MFQRICLPESVCQRCKHCRWSLLAKCQVRFLCAHLLFCQSGEKQDVLSEVSCPRLLSFKPHLHLHLQINFIFISQCPLFSPICLILKEYNQQQSHFNVIIKMLFTRGKVCNLSSVLYTRYFTYGFSFNPSMLQLVTLYR